MSFQPALHRSYIYAVIGAVATISLAAAAGIWRHDIDQRNFDARYSALTDEFANLVGDRFKLYQYGLRGARGAIVAGGEEYASRQSFENYIKSRDREFEFPGARGFGYIERVRKDQVDAFVTSARLDGFPDFAVREISPNAADRFLIKFIYPLKGNEGATGLDIGSEANRRNAAAEAARTGSVRLTAPITLVQASGQRNHGFLILMPIYKSDMPTATLDERMAAHFGWSYAPLVVSEVLRDLGPRQDEVAFSLTDVGNNIEFYDSPEFIAGKINSTRVIRIFGREWRISFHYTPAFLAREKNTQSFSFVGIICLAGTLLTAVIFGLEKNRERIWQIQSAESSNKVKSEFLASMSHEIRTPMTSVMGMADLLLENDLDDDSRKKVYQIKDSIRALLRIINDILDVSKLEAGKFELEYLDFHLPNIIRDVANLFAEKRHSSRANNVALEIDLADDFPTGVHLDPTRIRQLLTNLIGNARKFTEQGTIRIVGRLMDESTATPKIYIAVEDTGIGIKPETIATLFQDFTQADSTISRQYEGTGLGLSICKKLVALMDGEIGVDSTYGRGSTFWFKLPYVPAKTDVEAAPKPIAVASSYVAAKTIHVLVVDDNAINRQIISSILRIMGHTFELAENGMQAVEANKAGQFDLILMDVRMPVLSGPDATVLIRQTGGEKGSIPIIALTADAIEEHKKTYIEAGMNAVVTKPIEVSALALTINEVMEDEINIPDTGNRTRSKELPVNEYPATEQSQTEAVDDFLKQIGVAPKSGSSAG